MLLSKYIQILKEIFEINKKFVKSNVQRRRASSLRRKEGLKTWPTVDEVLGQNCVFVLSTGRCGTELLTKILNYSEKFYVEHSPKPELGYASSRIYQDEVGGNELKTAFLAARFDAFLLESWLRNRIYVETNNRITFFAQAIAELMPNAKFIHLVRNPADFVISGMRRGYYDDRVIQHQRLAKRNDEYFDKLTRIEKIALEWNEINARIEDFKSITNIRRVLTVKSEDLFSCPEVVKVVFNFLDVDDPFMVAGMESRLKKLLAKPVNRQAAGYFPRYNEWSETDKSKFKKVTTLASEYGYNY